MGWLSRLFGKSPDTGLGVEELAQRLGWPVDELQRFTPSYHSFRIPKRSGGLRLIHAPDAPTKQLQRRLLRRVLARLKAHPAATGFERNQSIVTNVRPHVGQAVVLRLDLRDFFPSTPARRVHTYFRAIGWSEPAAGLLARLTTHDGALPAGAPTSPRLSNLVNHRLDARLAALAASVRGTYSRYADDLTFSFPDAGHEANSVLHFAKKILAEEGYHLHTGKKLRIQRSHQQQLVTGLVVNARVQLPRATRRWLRAVEHRAAAGRPATVSPAQLQGWRALRHMVESQGSPGPS